jgi:hypothetical protein
MFRSLLRAALLSCLIALAGAAAAEEYKIRISLPAHVGERADAQYIATMNTHSVTNFDDRETKTDEDKRVELDGIEEVRKVDAKNRATQIILEVKRCEEVMKDGAKRTIISPGRTLQVTAKKDAEAELKLDQGTLAKKDEALVRLIVHLREHNDPDDDAIFGTTKPQLVGASWPINAKAFAKQPSQEGYDPVDPKNVKGKSTFVAVQDVRGFGTCLQLELDFTVEHMTGKQGEYKMIDGTYQSITEMLLPISDVDDSPAESWASQYHQTYTSTYDGKPVRVEQHLTRTIEGHRTMLPSKPASTTQPATVPSTRPTPRPLTTTTSPATKSATTSKVR